MGWRACQMLAVPILRALRCRARQVVAPLEAAGRDEASCLQLRIGDQRLIVQFDEPVPGQPLLPIGHQPAVLPGEEHEVAPIRGEVDIHVEIRGEYGLRIVDRMAPAMDRLTSKTGQGDWVLKLKSVWKRRAERTPLASILFA
jgi:hypothetical protein